MVGQHRFGWADCCLISLSLADTKSAQKSTTGLMLARCGELESAQNKHT